MRQKKFLKCKSCGKELELGGAITHLIAKHSIPKENLKSYNTLGGYFDEINEKTPIEKKPIGRPKGIAIARERLEGNNTISNQTQNTNAEHTQQNNPIPQKNPDQNPKPFEEVKIMTNGKEITHEELLGIARKNIDEIPEPINYKCQCGATIQLGQPYCQGCGLPLDWTGVQ